MTECRDYKIYKITNTVNNKIYIGQTVKTIKSRLQRHISDAFRELDTRFARAIKKYGKDSFIIEQIDQATNKIDCDTKERYWISYYNSINENIGYNSTLGGDGGNTYMNKSNEEMKTISEKISKGLIGRNNGNHTVIYVKNVKTNQVIEYGSMEDFCRQYGGNHSMIRNKLDWNTKYGIQTMYNETFIFSEKEDDFGLYTSFETKSGETPRKVTNLLTNESFVGINLRECAEHFGLENKFKLYTKKFKIEPYIKTVEGVKNETN